MFQTKQAVDNIRYTLPPNLLECAIQVLNGVLPTNPIDNHVTVCETEGYLVRLCHAHADPFFGHFTSHVLYSTMYHDLVL